MAEDTLPTDTQHDGTLVQSQLVARPTAASKARTEPTKAPDEATKLQLSIRPATRNRTAAASSQPKETGPEISDARTSRNYLETNLLYVPAGKPISLPRLSTALFQIAEMDKVLKKVVNAIRAAAYMLEGVQNGEVTETLNNTVITQYEETVTNLKTLTDTISRDIRKTIDDTTKKLGETVKGLVTAADASLRETADKVSKTTAPPTNFRDAVLGGAGRHGGMQIDPRVKAREGIRARQLLYEPLMPKSDIRTLEIPKLIERLNDAIKAVDEDSAHKVQSAQRFSNGGILVEMKSEEGADWLRGKDIAEAFELEMDCAITLKARSYNTITFFVPLTHDPGNPAHVQEICETNSLDKESITKT